MINNKTIKCCHCSKIFFDLGNDKCPYCKKEVRVMIDTFKDLFGKDNPFSNLMQGFRRIKNF